MASRILAFLLILTAQTAPGLAQGKLTSVYYHRPTRTYTTYYVNPASDTGSSLTPLNRKRIVDATRAVLAKKGLTPGDASADLLVNIVSVDSSRAGQRAGRPFNDWYRLFHGETAGPGTMGGQEPVGTLLPPGLLGNMADTTRSRARDTVAPPPLPPPKPQPSYVYGAVIIDVIDVGKRVLIWEGVANQPLDLPMKDPDKHIPGMVTRLVGAFDQAKAGAADSAAKGQTPK
jgi:Domain of unknown function (DUF4136)